MAMLKPLVIPKKPTGLSSTTGTVGIGELPGTEGQGLSQLLKKTKGLLKVSKQ